MSFGGYGKSGRMEITASIRGKFQNDIRKSIKFPQKIGAQSDLTPQKGIRTVP